MEPNHFTSSDLEQAMGSIFGKNYLVNNIIRIYGGAQKVTYKVDCTNCFSFILYVWDPAMDYFQEEKSENDIMQSGGADLFEMNYNCLRSHDIRTPKMLYIDRSKNKYPFDFAFVEYIKGGDISGYYDKSREIRDKVFSDLGKTIKKMHAVKSGRFGSLKSNPPFSQTCENIIWQRTLNELEYSSKNVEEINKNKDGLIKILNRLYYDIKPRNYYSLVHGELGPNHVMVDDNLKPYLIDIECLMYFDVEYEHSFMEFRFDNYNDYLKEEDLDPIRLRFYKLHHHIACVTGACKLLSRGYPDKDELEGMIEYNLREALKFLVR